MEAWLCTYFFCICKLQCLWNRSSRRGNHSLCISTSPEDKSLTDSITCVTIVRRLLPHKHWLHIMASFIWFLGVMVFDTLDSNLSILFPFFFRLQILFHFLHLHKFYLWFKRLLKVHLLHEVFSDHSIWNNLFSLSSICCLWHSFKTYDFCLCKFAFGYCMSNWICWILPMSL